jgi:hypothetical protein
VIPAVDMSGIVSDGAPARHVPITAGRHLMEKFRSTVG